METKSNVLCNIHKGISVLISLWIMNVFLMSLPYKFSGHPDTQHIFSTIGQWISETVHKGLGEGFSEYAAYVIGGGELIVSILLLIPVTVILLKLFGFLKTKQVPKALFGIGGLGAALLMGGAIFFHTQTPLGVEVIHNGESDGGSLFKAAVSIFVLGITLFVSYFHSVKSVLCKNCK
ncbi:MAG: hypothetical protein GY828_00240 [Candidatus Gracilibacteria bacterium]|nr:hypothetical protein [Candidatus Gracilibacteria bacterium]